MPYTRTYRTIIPVDPDADIDLLRWLSRESFEKKAAGDGLRICGWSEKLVPADDIPPKAGKQLGRPVDSFQWWEYTAQATNAPVVADA